MTEDYHILDNPPEHPRAEDHPVQYVFSIGDRNYYHMVNSQSIYYERFMALEDKFREAENRVTDQFLKVFVEKMEKYFNDGQLAEIGNMIVFLKQRLEYLPSIEHLYNLCSVWFFDQKESPFTFDHQYCFNKVELWKQHKEVLAFFLSVDMQRYFPSWDGLETSILDYTKAVALSETLYQKYHLYKLSKIGASPELVKSIGSRLETLRTLLSSVE